MEELNTIHILLTGTFFYTCKCFNFEFRRTYVINQDFKMNLVGCTCSGMNLSFWFYNAYVSPNAEIKNPNEESNQAKNVFAQLSFSLYTLHKKYTMWNTFHWECYKVVLSYLKKRRNQYNIRIRILPLIGIFFPKPILVYSTNRNVCGLSFVAYVD